MQFENTPYRKPAEIFSREAMGERALALSLENNVVIDVIQQHVRNRDLKPLGQMFKVSCSGQYHKGSKNEPIGITKGAAREAAVEALKGILSTLGSGPEEDDDKPIISSDPNV